MKKIIAIIFFFPLISFGQKQTNIWYFGNLAGLDFNSGLPVALNNGMVNTWEGSSVISDTSGNLLFYTDGRKVWNRNHIQMANGFGLMGDITSTQTALIIPKPLSDSIYYIFTTESFVGPYGLRYSIVDMSFAGGYGDVTNKNILLNAATTEKLTGVINSNSTDVWVVAHEWNTNAFLAYSVTSGGVNAIPIISNLGIIYNLSTGGYGGQMKISPDGTKLVSILGGYPQIELYDFNNSTGIISNLKTLQVPGGSFYGVEFSTNSTLLYASPYAAYATYQMDLTAGSASAISNSAVMIDSSLNWKGALQLASDGKIYAAISNFSNGGSDYINVINSPDSLGLACNYIDSVVFLSGAKCLLGFPNFLVSLFNPQPSLGLLNNSPVANYIIYPNPVIDKLNITTNNNAISEFILYDISSRKIMQQKFTNSVWLNTEQLAKGIYLYEVRNKNGVIKKGKVVKD